MKKTISYIIFLLVILIVAYFWQSKSTTIIPTNTEQTINVSFQFTVDNIVTVPYNSTTEDLFTITQKIAQDKNWGFAFADYDDLGLLITQINDKINGTEQKYWQYYVNEDIPMIAVNNYFPKNNDNIKWIFQESKF